MSVVSESRMPSRQRMLVVAVVVGWVAVVGLGAMIIVHRHTATPEVVEGWAMPNGRGTAIGLYDTAEGGTGTGYVISGARWAGVDGSWHEGGEVTCVGTDTRAMVRVQLGVIEVPPDVAPGGSHVVWLRCLE